MKATITSHYLGTKGLKDKEIKGYHKRLHDLRHSINKDCPDKDANEELFELPEGFRFFYQEWPATQKDNITVPKAIVFALHGAYGCSDIFYPLADALNPKGITVIALDYRGHGRTGGQAGGNLGDITSFSLIYQDINLLVKKYINEYDIPIYFFGYDIGALIAMQVIHRNPKLPVDGLIMASPMWHLKNSVKQSFLYPFVSVGKMFGKGKAVHKIFPEIMKPTYFEEYITYAKQNPFWLKKMSYRMFKNLLDLINSSQRLAKKINIPSIIFQGTADSLVDHFAVQKLYEKWKHPNKRIRFYENADHNLLMNKFTKEIYDETLNFLDIPRET
ncbi:MAG: alpha/beta fold hydrolase [Promethearchaeota archaeon]